MSNNSEKSSKRIMMIAIVLLAIVVFGLMIALLAVNSSKKKEDNKTTEEVVATSSDATTTEEETTEQTTEESGLVVKKEVVSVYGVNSWEADGRYFTQFEMRVQNYTEETFKNWKVEIKVPEDTEVSDLWNGAFSVERGVLSIIPMDYNSEIPVNDNVSNIGFILSSADRDALSKVGEEDAFYSDGKLIDDVVLDMEAQLTEESVEPVVSTPPKKEEGTPYANHGALTLDGVNIVDENGEPYQLHGVSTHGLAWFPEYVNKDAFQTFRDEWGVNLVRLAMYTDENGGYCSGGDKEKLKSIVCNGVDYATELGLYVIIDWHVLHDLNPLVNEDQALLFFDEMSKKYADYGNVIYEICNEPNGGTTWEDVKKYAEDVIPVIRKNAPNAIIIVGTPTWSQDVDIAAQNPITGYDNIMYAVHFYAATHKDNIRNKVSTALDKGIPVFISEFSICDASGNGAIDYNEAETWFKLINDNNLSYAAWNISNKNETSSLIKASCTKTSGWSDDELSDTGIWLKKKIRQASGLE